jgi:hypothetical protein
MEVRWHGAAVARKSVRVLILFLLDINIHQEKGSRGADGWR